MDQLRPRGAAAAPPTGPAGSPTMRARLKLQQARALMTKGDYAAASALADEAEAMKVNYQPGEDTPRRVKDDILQARKDQAKAKEAANKPTTTASGKLDAKSLLTQGRAAYEHDELDRAEQLAKDAQKAESTWSMHLWGDSPSKLLADIQVKRSKQARAAALAKSQQASAKTAERSKPAGVTDPSPKRRHRRWTQGRRPPTWTPPGVCSSRAARPSRIEELARARELAQQAAQKKPDLEWWEDTPERLLADVRQAENKAAAKDRR